MKIAISHILLKIGSRKVNYDRVKRSVSEAKEKGAHVVLLPSMFNIGTFQNIYTVSQAKEIAKNVAEKIPGKQSSNLLVKLAITYDVHILAGPILERAGPRLFLTSMLVSPSGVVTGRYRKIALDVIDRAIGISPGRGVNIANLKNKVGVLSEHDILYPEISRMMVMAGASLLINFARIGELNDRKLERLGETRSIENNVPMIVVGGGLESAERVLTETPSLVIDPKEGVLERITLDELGKNVTYGVIAAEVRPSTAFPLPNAREVMDLISLLYRNSKELFAKGRE